MPTKPDRTTKKSSATKADNAPVPVHIWNNRAWPALRTEHNTQATQALDTIRAAMLRRWKQNIIQDFCIYIKEKYGSINKIKCTNPNQKYELSRDYEVGVEAIIKAGFATFWSWPLGSTFFFWRFPRYYQRVARDGIPWGIKSSKPKRSWRRPQPQPPDDDTKAKVCSKITKVIQRKYLEPNGFIDYLTRFFAVPKGDNDICVVYDALVSGVNSFLWVPGFRLPTLNTLCSKLDPWSLQSDKDLGEMFHNHTLHPSLRRYAGVDLTHYFKNPTDETKTNWQRWTRCCMGMMGSPYQAIKTLRHIEEIIEGPHNDSDNPYWWDRIRLNLPGDPHYNPGLPWVSKVVSVKNSELPSTHPDYQKFPPSQPHKFVANGQVSYVDDSRFSGRDDNNCWATQHKFGCTHSYLGGQDASRKTTPPTSHPGPWAGSVIHGTTQPDGSQVIVTYATDDKWSRTKAQIAWIQQQIQQYTPPTINFKTLESVRGCFVYLARTYPAINPYLKGLHLTLDGWRPDRKPNLWKYTRRKLAVLVEDGTITLPPTQGTPPE